MNAVQVEARLKNKPRLFKVSGDTEDININGIFYRFAIVCIIVAFLFLGYLAERAVLSQNIIKIDQINKEIEQVELEHQELLVKNAGLKSPNRIEQVAIEELSMVVPDHINYIQLPADYSFRDKEVGEEEVFPIAIAEDFWLYKLFRAADGTIRSAVSPGQEAQALTQTQPD